MAYLALYRKYRPTSFDEVFGQDNVVKVLKNAVINDRVSHAYLFAGPRGTGKTTMAKILAKIVNCDNLVDGNPCGKCDSCLNILNSSDVVEIDAASNNGVDEIRNLREKVNLVPSQNKFKIYIIDEVHMLTTQAFNALLKTLEEPPKYVIFILATTEPNKIPLTISSRCQKFQFSRITDDCIVKRLKQISECEKINITDDALYEIARVSDGGMRDAINLLDQLCSYNIDTIDVSDVYNVYGTISYADICNLFKNISTKNNTFIVDFVDKIDNNGINLSKFIEEVLVFLRDVLVYKSCGRELNIKIKNDSVLKFSSFYSEKDIYYFINNLNDLLGKLKFSVHPNILLTACLLSFSFLNNTDLHNDMENEKKSVSNGAKDNTIAVSSSFDISKNDVNIIKKNVLDKTTNIVLPSLKYVNALVNNTFAIANKKTLNDVCNKLKNISDYLSIPRHTFAINILSDVAPRVAGDGYIVFSSEYEAIVNKFNSNLNLISNFLIEVFNAKYSVIALINADWESRKKEFIENHNNGVKYSLLPLPDIFDNNDGCINTNDDDSNNNVEQIDVSNDVDKLVNIVGNDSVEYI